MDLRTHRGLLRLAIQHSPDGEALRDFCLALRDEKETVKNDVVSQKPLALQWVSLRLRGDRDVVLAAVRQDGRSLQWATLSLRENKDVVLAAIHSENHGGKAAFDFASLTLRECSSIREAAGIDMPIKDTLEAAQTDQDDGNVIGTTTLVRDG